MDWELLFSVWISYSPNEAANLPSWTGHWALGITLPRPMSRTCLYGLGTTTQKRGQGTRIPCPRFVCPFTSAPEVLTSAPHDGAEAEEAVHAAQAHEARQARAAHAHGTPKVHGARHDGAHQNASALQARAHDAAAQGEEAAAGDRPSNAPKTESRPAPPQPPRGTRRTGRKGPQRQPSKPSKRA